MQQREGEAVLTRWCRGGSRRSRNKAWPAAARSCRHTLAACLMVRSPAAPGPPPCTQRTRAGAGVLGATFSTTSSSPPALHHHALTPPRLRRFDRPRRAHERAARLSAAAPVSAIPSTRWPRPLSRFVIRLHRGPGSACECCAVLGVLPALTPQHCLGSHTRLRSSRGRPVRRTPARRARSRAPWRCRRTPPARRPTHLRSSSSLRLRSTLRQRSLRTTTRRTAPARPPWQAPLRRRLRLHRASQRLAPSRTTAATRATPPLPRLAGLSHLAARVRARARTFGPVSLMHRARSSRCSPSTDGCHLRLRRRMLCSPTGRSTGTLRARLLRRTLHLGRSRSTPRAVATRSPAALCRHRHRLPRRTARTAPACHMTPPLVPVAVPTLRLRSKPRVAQPRRTPHDALRATMASRKKSERTSAPSKSQLRRRELAPRQRRKT